MIIEYINNDLIKLIFNFLSINDIKECRLICKSFINIITLLYFSKVDTKIVFSIEFFDFINKYNLRINAINIINPFQLQNIMNIYPEIFVSIKFNIEFNSEIKQLPKGLLKVQFNNSFNQKIKDGFLPKTLTYLTFGKHFNQPILLNTFPLNLSHLEFGEDFDQPLYSDSLPSNITHLELGKYFDQDLTNVLPLNLRYLIISSYYDKKRLSKISKSIRVFISIDTVIMSRHSDYDIIEYREWIIESQSYKIINKNNNCYTNEEWLKNAVKNKMKPYT
jgi:hypothetical protein